MQSISRIKYKSPLKYHNYDTTLNFSPYVKSVFTISGDDETALTKLPFFADGFPGLMYQKTTNGLKIHPHTKQIPVLFLYGQTIEPIEIEVFGTYEIVVIQLYPFTLKRLFDMEPKSIIDDCIDLTNHKCIAENNTLQKLACQVDLKDKIAILFSYLQHMIAQKQPNLDNLIFKAVKKIIAAKGQINLKDTAKELYITSRTLERRFQSETGLSPKQFAKIIQFQNSMIQLSKKEYNLLTEIVYENGYADQSHFIKVFKSFTKHTPKQFVKS